MRRQLVLVMVGIVAGALLLAGAGTYLLAGRGVRADDAQTALRQARLVAAEVPLILDVRSRTLRRGVLRVLRETDGVRFVAVDGAGRLRGRIPGGLQRSALDGSKLLGGVAQSGTTGDLAFALVPVTGVSPAVLRRLGVGAGFGLLLVQPEPRARLGLTWLLVASGATLAVAVAVAGVVSRRISRPLVDAVATTRRLAEGDLSARAQSGRAYPELESLTASINAMAGSLARSRTLERQFLLSVSHDLRTPLTSILGYAEAIGDGTATDVHAGAAIIASEARRLERLVGDLLELARLDSQQFSLHPRSVDVAAVVVAAAEGLRPSIEEAGLRLEVQGPGTPLPGVLDPDRLSQVVANLVENASKFATGLVRVSVLAEGAWARIVVDDDGPGIAPEEQGRVFERFFQGDVRPAVRQAGSGLGLAIVAELVAAMGGSVGVSSPLLATGGTRMEVRLPVVARR